MFTKLEINRFRSFELFSMDNIAPITLIGGRNNSGKSAILEAIFLLFGFRNPDIYYALAFGRNGNGQLKISPQKIWDPLFYNFDQTQSFQIKMYRANDVVSDLKMEKVPDDKIGFDINKDNVSDFFKSGISSDKINTAFYSLHYDYSVNENKSSGNFTIQESKIKYDSVSNAKFLKLPFIKVIRYKANSIPDNVTIAEWVSKFALDNKKDDLLSLLKYFDQNIKDITTIVDAGIPYVVAILNDGTKLPITLMGDGINKTLQILLCILTTPSGIVLIDEIENGIHYSAYEKMLQVFYDAALKMNCQLIITTHSSDILKESINVMEAENKLDKLSYQRLDYSAGKRRAYAFTGDELKDAVDAEMEVR